MIKLYEGGAYLVNGKDIIEDGADQEEILKSRTGSAVSRQEAAKNTMAYNILNAHNTSNNMEKLQIKFDKLTSHDITFVGIIQTARASGLEKFPIPYVLTNCHNSLCAVGEPSMKMTICLVSPVRRSMVECMFLLIKQSFISMRGKCWQNVVQ